jgi:sarcosine oxidase
VVETAIGKHYHTIVIGLGAMGSAALYQLTRRGRRALGIEQFDVPNDMGSSHGLTRIIRLAYYEHPSYVPLLRRAYELWHELEERTGESLLCETGSIDAGPFGSAVFEGSLRSCELHGLPHEVFTSTQLRRRFPGYQLPADTMAVLQPQGGYLRPERCVIAHTAAAQAKGADVHTRERVTAWEPKTNGVRVVTDHAEYTADHLVICAGAWMAGIVEILKGITIPERQVVAWFQPHRAEYFMPGSFPVFNIVVPEGRYYGFPVAEAPGFKIGRYHHRAEIVDPEHVDRDCKAEDESLLRDLVTRYFPEACGPTLRMQSCIFTNSPDEHFILDVHPDWPQVILASPCSGHGFKFASVVGEILADLVERGRTDHDISLLRLGRFQTKPTRSAESST